MSLINEVARAKAPMVTERVHSEKRLVSAKKARQLERVALACSSMTYLFLAILSNQTFYLTIFRDRADWTKVALDSSTMVKGLAVSVQLPVFDSQLNVPDNSDPVQMDGAYGHLFTKDFRDYFEHYFIAGDLPIEVWVKSPGLREGALWDEKLGGGEKGRDRDAASYLAFSKGVSLSDQATDVKLQSLQGNTQTSYQYLNHLAGEMTSFLGRLFQLWETISGAPL